MTEDSDKIARWIEPTSIRGADLTPEEERPTHRALRRWRRYNATGDRTESVELRILPADSGAPSEPAEE